MMPTFGEAAVSSTPNARPATIGIPGVWKSACRRRCRLRSGAGSDRALRLPAKVRLQQLAGKIRNSARRNGRHSGNGARSPAPCADETRHSRPRDSDSAEERFGRAADGRCGSGSTALSPARERTKRPAPMHQQCRERDLKSDHGLADDAFRCPVAVRPPSFNPSVTSARVAASAGASPNKTPVKIVTAAVKAKHRPIEVHRKRRQFPCVLGQPRYRRRGPQ